MRIIKILFLVLLTLLLFTCSKDNKAEIVIGISQRWGDTTFPTIIAQGAFDSAKSWEDKNGVKIKFIKTDCDNDPVQQVRDMEYLADQKIDGLLLFPGDSQIVSEPLKYIYNSKNIPVIITDIGVDYGDYVSMIITNNTRGGEMAAEEMARQIPAGSEVIVFNNGPGNNNARQRADGFIEKAKKLGFKVLPERTLNIDEEEGRQLMEKVLLENPQVKGVFTLTIEPALGAAKALRTIKKTDCKIIAFDINKEGIKMVKDGSLAACILQDPYFMGVEAVNQLMYYFNGNTSMINKIIDSPTVICTKANTARFETNPQVNY